MKNSNDKENEVEDYHGIAPISHIIKKMKKEYDKDPKDWRIVGHRDKNGNKDTFIKKKPNTFWLKSRKLSPYSALSMGTIIRNIDRDIDQEVCGKEISKKDMLSLFGMVVPINKKKQNIVASGIENYSREKGSHFKKIIGERKPNVGYQLAKKVDEKFRHLYPRKDEMYG
jgi:hypothetical protein